MTRQYSYWSKEQTEFLIANHFLPCLQLAQELGRSKRAVKNKIQHLRHAKIIPGKGGYEPYSQEEEELLATLGGTMPISDLAQTWNKLAKRKGWSLRSENGLRSKLIQLGETSAPEVGYFTAEGLALALGCSSSVVKTWIRDKKLKAKKDNDLKQSHWRIRDKDFVNFALTYTQEISRLLSSDGVNWLLMLIADVKGKKNNDEAIN